jgi:hypothetical protein
MKDKISGSSFEEVYTRMPCSYSPFLAFLPYSSTFLLKPDFTIPVLILSRPPSPFLNQHPWGELKQNSEEKEKKSTYNKYFSLCTVQSPFLST